jgi:hypothetical protein
MRVSLKMERSTARVSVSMQMVLFTKEPFNRVKSTVMVRCTTVAQVNGTRVSGI